MPAVNPKILIWARETAGLSLEEAAHALGFKDSQGKTSAEKLDQFESGQEEPGRSLLVKMSQKYKRSLLVFYLSAPPKQGNRGQDFRVLPGDRPYAYNAHLDALIRELSARQRLTRSLLEDEEAERLAFIGSVRMGDGVSAVVQSILAVSGFELRQFRAAKTIDEAFSYLRERIEDIGIFVLLAGNLGSHHSAIPVDIFRGFALADDVAPFIVINDQDNRTAWSFTLLHEVAHLWLGQTGISGSSAEAQIEQFCNDVAGELLLPAAEVLALQEVQSLSIAEGISLISDFARDRNISRSMVAYKLYKTKTINEAKWRELDSRIRQEWIETKAQRQDKESRNNGGPNYYVVRRHRLGQALLTLVNSSLGNGNLTPTKAGKILGVKPRNVGPLLKDVSTRGES
jgi:Zn-dependent peptidase ImmA (M78 family)/transcriptional regulator with XRE-family HTH domain